MNYPRRLFIRTPDTLGRKRAPRVAFWKTMPLGARINFYAGVFALFASVGLISLAMQWWQLTLAYASAVVLITGSFAVGYAAISVARRFWLFPVLGITEGIIFKILIARYYSHAPRLLAAGSPLQRQLIALCVASIFSIILGYVLFVAFFTQQGSRLFRAQTEITLAGEIHQALVPAIEHNWGPFQIYGASIPSGEVGGDLVDVVGGPEGWTAYIADVSGHGVSAGVLMAMFKTAVRTCGATSTPDILLLDVHRALYPLKTLNTFVTAGVLQFRSGSQLLLSLAGQPPLLHFKGGTLQVEEHPPSDMPVGILPEQSFSAIPVECEPEDVLLLLTDGLSEVFDKQGKEMGLDPIKAALAKSATVPLPELFRRLRQVALDAGRQQDDQTMLLIRRAA